MLVGPGHPLRGNRDDRWEWGTVGSKSPESATIDFRLLIGAITISVDMSFVERDPIVLLNT